MWRTLVPSVPQWLFTTNTPPAQAGSPPPLAAAHGAAIREVPAARAIGPRSETDIEGFPANLFKSRQRRSREGLRRSITVACSVWALCGIGSPSRRSLRLPNLHSRAPPHHAPCVFCINRLRDWAPKTIEGFGRSQTPLLPGMLQM